MFFWLLNCVIRRSWFHHTGVAVVTSSELAEIREELCKSKSIAITILKAASDWRSGYVIPLKARSNVMTKT
jgi:hypothetical protein